MSNQYLRVNEGDLMPLESVKRISKINETERRSLAELGPQVDADKFNTRIERADGTKSYATQSVDDFAREGTALSEVDTGRFVPTANVLSARNLTAEDKARFEERTGRDINPAFKAQVDTKAGAVWANVSAEIVMSRVFQPHNAMPEKLDLAQERDAVMAQAAPATNKAASLTKSPMPDQG